MFKLLIVDDNNMQIKSLLTFIDWASFEVTDIKTASNGKKGLEIFKTFMPDIVITDVVMPNMNGIDMTKEIQAIKKDVKIIYMSCYEDSQYLKSAMDNKVVSYILKPIDSEKLTQTISDVLTQLKNEKKQEEMRQMFERNWKVFRETFLFRLLYSDNLDIKFVSQTLKEIEFQKYDSYLVVRFEITSEVQEFIEIYELLEVINKSILNEIEGHAFVETKRIANLILMGNRMADISFSDYVADMILKCIDTFSEKVDAEISVGFSKVSPTLLDAPLMLRQATYALENNLNIGENNICFFKHFNYITMEYNITELKNNLNDMIYQRSPEAVDLFLDRYWIKGESYQFNEIKSFCLTVMVTLQFLLYERNLNINDIFDGSEIIWQKIERFETIKNARMWLYNILNLIITYFGKEEENRQDKLVSDIISYIEKHYGEISNVEQIASSVYISPSYAKNLFKKNTGKTISEYLNNYRMAEAKRLLTNPNAKVYEVAKAVGYKSKPYFIKAFKKFTGQLPSEWQKTNMEKES